MRRIGFTTVLCSALALGAVVGCGNVGEPSQSGGAKVVRAQAHPLVFQNRTQEYVTSPDARFDPQTVGSSLYENVPVLQADGKPAHLDVARGPILFVAYWCPHCQRTLQLFTKLISQFKQTPTLVAVGYPKGATLADAVRINHTERQQLRLANFPTYYMLASDAW
ncbi:hypothetical protein GCM10025858_36810 [Alicyclobacillus sacchari]|uniref:hypothetical protein n=1 Tax=Alicyclobacillus sacchari TaxID=392010 RepID=UPI0023EA12C5|nr:hypothetical protein [Alicyclobacillus sacchari]GMA59178.1 hypothetical protein GCM10025858_36810 [Alicyclobacillus sacchari]